MSRLLISQYYSEVDKIAQYGGSVHEGSISNVFAGLLNGYCKTQNYLLIPQLEYRTKFGTPVRPDGTVKDAIRLDHGWWESKDKYDKLDEEIEKKLAKGYPDENILFEDSVTAVLIQHGQEQSRVLMRDEKGLDKLLNSFVAYERPAVRDFRSAIVKFKEDIPHILVALRDIINATEQTNSEFRERRNAFLEVCRQSINPEIGVFDIHEMLIQHILTEDIFANIFHESQFHRENNIARELSAIIETFFVGATKKNALKSIEHYYAVIRRNSENIANHHEKQKFLKAVYENFYKAYNPKAADRLGIVYTPNEIVRFMIESTDYLVHKHFGKMLADPGVEILDPCTGTGTYVTELIEYLPKDKLAHKYKHEIHCNEMAILPYYIANLNIEYTYQQKMGVYEEFKNICLVDTLDHCSASGHQFDLFSMSVQNTARIQQQNDRTISVIIGNPPYNANQENENDNNKNREYPDVDKCIKSTYVKQGTAQKVRYYDPYFRFFRWATDRLSKDGVIAFITNSSFIHRGIYDGFRKTIFGEFSDIYVVDLGGNIHENPKLSGTTHNVFGIQIGVTVIFLVKDSSKRSENCKVFFCERPESELAEDKLSFLAGKSIQDIAFQHVIPDGKSYWTKLTSNDFDEFIPVASKETKSTSTTSYERAIFKSFSNGLSTGRDEWIYDYSSKNLDAKIKYFLESYRSAIKRYKNESNEEWFSLDKLCEDFDIKWSRNIKSKVKRKDLEIFDSGKIGRICYRPYIKKFLYRSDVLVDEFGLLKKYFLLLEESPSGNNSAIWLKSGVEVPTYALGIDSMPDYQTQGGSQCLPLYRYEKNGDRIDNITDWGLTQFQTHYNDPKITKEHIFHYTYAILHHPAYRTKYAINLKREFPRLPFYPDFHQWATWGQTLMSLHLNYETIAPYGLKRTDKQRKTAKPKQENLFDTPDSKKPIQRTIPKAKLQADKTDHKIILDTDTELLGIPPIAWDYKLGNRSALEWILDQYKEKTPKDPTIRAKFNTYKFADYKEHVIDLLDRVCTVSVKTMEIIQQMPDTVDHQGGPSS